MPQTPITELWLVVYQSEALSVLQEGGFKVEVTVYYRQSLD